MYNSQQKALNICRIIDQHDPTLKHMHLHVWTQLEGWVVTFKEDTWASLDDS